MPWILKIQCIYKNKYPKTKKQKSYTKTKPHKNTNTISKVQTEVKLEHTNKIFSVCRTILRVSGAASEGNMARAVRKSIDKQSPFSVPMPLF